MTSEAFTEILEDTINQMRQTLISKGNEYSPSYDRLSNFKSASSFLGVTSKMALWGFVTKHIIALNDFINRDFAVSPKQWDEKIQDIINYMVLLRALLIEEGKI